MRTIKAIWRLSRRVKPRRSALDDTASASNRPAADAQITLQPIAAVHNGVHDFRAGGWADVVSEIDIRPELAEGLARLEGFSHLILITWLHRAVSEARPALLYQVLGDPHGPPAGVFALRLAMRPNSIGCSVVHLLRVHGNRISVRGLDALDGTPVLDIKPYLPAYDSHPGARMPEWATLIELSSEPAE